MSTPAQNTLSVQPLLTKIVRPPRPFPLYSPNLALRDFFLPWMKKVLKGKHFNDVEEMKQKMAEAQEDIKINAFKHCFEQWENTS